MHRPNLDCRDSAPLGEPFVLIDPPSPADTEIVVEDEEIDEEGLGSLLARNNIKVRDFAFEPDPAVTPATVIRNPILELMEYDKMLFESPRVRPVPGRTLRRLLDIGWITQEECKRDWSEVDWQALREYDATGPHPWKPQKVDKPSEEERAEKRQQRAKLIGTLEDRVRSQATIDPPPAIRQSPPVAARSDLTTILSLPSAAKHGRGISTNSIPCERGRKRLYDIEICESEHDTPIAIGSPPKRSRSSPLIPPPENATWDTPFGDLIRSLTPNVNNT
jgi:hypothetical protein